MRLMRILEGNQSGKRGDDMEGCIFCRIAAGEVKAEKVYQDKEIVAFRDINPQAPVHVLLVPRRHIPSLLEAEGENALLGSLTSAAAQLARELGVAESGFRLVVNCGPAAGQVVPHLHFHFLAGRELGWPPG